MHLIRADHHASGHPDGHRQLGQLQTAYPVQWPPEVLDKWAACSAGVT